MFIKLKLRLQIYTKFHKNTSYMIQINTINMNTPDNTNNCIEMLQLNRVKRYQVFYKKRNCKTKRTTKVVEVLVVVNNKISIIHHFLFLKLCNSYMSNKIIHVRLN